MPAPLMVTCREQMATTLGDLRAQCDELGRMGVPDDAELEYDGETAFISWREQRRPNGS